MVFDTMASQPRTRSNSVRDRSDSDGILSQSALAFVAGLVQRFQPRIDLLLRARAQRDAAWAAAAVVRAGRVVGVTGYHAGEELHVVRRPDGTVGHLEVATFVYTRTPYDPEAPIPGGAPRG